MANYDNFHWESHRDGPHDLLDTSDRFDQEYEDFEYYDDDKGEWIDDRTPAMKEVHEELMRLAQLQELKWEEERRKNDENVEQWHQDEGEIWPDEISENLSPSNQEPVFHPPVFEIR